jgi:hypothetical protein
VADLRWIVVVHIPGLDGTVSQALDPDGGERLARRLAGTAERSSHHVRGQI